MNLDEAIALRRNRQRRIDTSIVIVLLAVAIAIIGASLYAVL